MFLTFYQLFTFQYLEGKLAILTNTFFIFCFSKTFDSKIENVFNSSIVIMFITLYISLLIYEYVCINNYYKYTLSLDKTVDEIKSDLFLKDYARLLIQARFRQRFKYFTTTISLGSKSNLRMVYLFIFKKWMFAFILVAFYGAVKLQLFVLLALHLLMLTFIFYKKPYITKY